MKNKLLLLLLLLFLASHSYALTPGIKYIKDPWKAPEIGLTDIDGAQHTLIKYQGRLLIINFWGTWCQPCRKEMPALQRAYEQLKKENISIIAIAVGDSSSDVIQYRNKNPVDFALLADKDSVLSTRWPIPALPTTYLINQKSEVIIRVIGDYEWDNPKLLEEIKALNSDH